MRHLYNYMNLSKALKHTKNILLRLRFPSFLFLTSVLLLFELFLTAPFAGADPYPPLWSNGTGAAIHFQPVAWPSEPADPKNCGASCGSWKPYTRFQNSIDDPRTQDPSNGGTAPQNYVNISSGCNDKSLPGIYYYLYQGATPTDDVIMFRWRVEQIANTYATGPSAGNYGATDPWSSALWTVLFDLHGNGYVELAAHLDGSSGAPSTSIDRIAGIWSKLPTQSLDYIGDPTNVKLIAHNPTAFIGTTNKILNFHNNLTPDESWPNGSSETNWDYGTTRSKVVTTSPCNEYFVDYQIPVAMIDASSLGGPKITRSTPISMLFCTANSLTNPFQKDCALNKTWTGAAAMPGPFGDYLSFDQANPYSQPIISSVTAVGPDSCPGSYSLTAVVQDTLAVVNGVVIPSVKAVDFYYWYDANGDGTTAGDTGSAWTKITPTAALKSGTLNTWNVTWNATSLPKGQYFIGVQAVDDNTKVDDGMTPTGIDNRTFSYVVGDSQNRIYINGTSYAVVPPHSPPITPSSTENWWGNPSVTGTQTALVGTALNNCGKAPTITKTASVSSVAAGATMSFTITINNLMTSAVTVSQIQDTLPAGFAYVSGTTSGDFGTSNPSASGQTLTWTFSTPVSIAAGISKSLTFNVTAPATSGNYSNTATATTSFGTLTSAPVSVAVDAARVSLSKTPSVYSINPDGTTQLVYTLAYSNDSTVSVTNASISDILPGGVTYASCSGGSSCSNSGGTVTWTIGALAGGASGTVTLTVTVNSNYSTSSITNSATLSVTAPDNSTVTKTASSTIAVNVPIPAFTLTKTASAVQIAPGGSVTWTITYNNYGAGAASGVTITDTLPAGFTYSSNTGGGTNSSGTVTWSIGSVAAGASGSVTVTATAANPFTSTNPATNNASLNWTGNTGPAVTATNEVGITGNACSTYYFRKTTASVGFDGTKQLASVSPVPQASDVGGSTSITVPGGANTYSATVLSFYQDPATISETAMTGNLTTNIHLDRNPGPGITIRATVYDYNSTTGARVQLGQSTTSFTGSQTGLLTFTLPLSGTLAKDHRILWTYEATSNNSQSTTLLFQYDGTVANSISGTIPATFANSNAAFCVTPPAVLTLSKTVDKANVTGGTATSIQYTLTFANTGQTMATGTQVIDTLPTGVTFVSATLNGASVTPAQSGQQLTFSNVKSSTDATAGDVTGGTSGTIVINATVGSSASGTLTNTASISSTQTSAVTATATTMVGGSGTPALSLSKSVDKTLLSAGGTATYTLTVVNTGTGAASSVVVTDALPVSAYYTYGTCTTATGTCSQASNTLTWNAGTLSVGSSATLTFTMIAGSTGLPAGVTVISNTASAIATSVSSVSSNTVTVTLSGNPNLTLTKSASPSSSLKPGDTVTYTMTVANNGSASASSVVVTDPIPSGVSYKGTITASAGSGSFDAINNQVIFSVGTLTAGASATLSFQITINTPAAGTTSISILNTATASAANAASKTATASITGTATPTLTISKSGPSQMAYPAATLTQTASTTTTVFVNSTAQLTVGQYVSIGSTTAQITAATSNTLTIGTAVSAASGASVIPAITYNISYQNTGTGIAQGVILTDSLPAGSTFVLASNSGSNSSGTVTWSLGNLDPNASGSVTLTIIPGGAGTLTNSAHITCTGCTPPTDPTVTTKVGGLVVTKLTTTPTRSAPGTAIWEITVENTLASTVSGFTVTDTLPGGFTYASTSSIAIDGVTATASTNPSNGDQSLTWSGFSAGIPAGKKLVITFNSGIASSTGAATYQNDAGGTSTTGGVTPFDPLLTTAEDVTILAASTGVLDGYIYRRNDSNTTFNAGVDTPLTNVKVKIEYTSGDCNNSNSATCYIVYTDSSGYYLRVLPIGTWIVTVDSTTGDLAGSGLTLVVGINPNSVTVPNQGLVSNDNGYSGNTYTVTYNGNTNTGGTAPTDGSSPYNYNSSVTVLGNTGPLTKTGYTFANWNTAANGTGTSYAAAATFTITANTTLYAQWTINTYTVTYNGNTNTGGTAPTDGSSPYNYNSSVTVLGNTGPLTKTGYTFANWNTAANGTGTSYAAAATFTITANTTLYAQWTINTYTVTYNGNTNTGGTAPTDSSSPYNYNSSVTVLGNTGPLTKTGYTFANWNTAANGSGTSYAPAATFTITANTTLYAQWTINTYTLTVNSSNPGSGVSITVSPNDNNSQGSGSTSFTRTYNNLTAVTITAPLTAGGNNFSSWSGCDSASGITCNVTMTSNKTVTAAYATPANGSIAGSIWYDLNKNNKRDGNETGRSGWRVELLSGGVVISITTTDSTGHYIFSGLNAGTYTVRFINPNGYNLSSGPMPVNGENGSPVSGGGTPSLSQLSNIVLTADSSGNVSSVSQQSLPIDPSGTVYNSITRQPVSGATVTLLYNGTAINPAYVAGGSATQTTGSDGSYAFFILPGAPAGTYDLSVSANNYTFPSGIIPPTTIPGGFSGGAVTSISGAPQTGQNTTYYLQFNKPATDITNNNIPLDSAQSNAVSVPTMSEWGMIIFMILAGIGAIYFMRKRKAL